MKKGEEKTERRKRLAGDEKDIGNWIGLFPSFPRNLN